MSFPLQRLICRAFFYLLLLLLGACAPPTAVAPSPALKEQLQIILQQQQQQSTQIEALQQQIETLQQQLSGENQLSARIEEQLPAGEEAPLALAPPPPLFRPPTEELPAAASQEIAQLTQSATAYLAAFTDLASGRYAAAEKGFQDFLGQFPEHQYTDNARFWLADAQQAQGKLQLAEANLKQVIDDPAGSDRIPPALLKLANIYRDQGLNLQADEVLDRLRTNYPDTVAAQQSYRSDRSQ